MATLSAPIAPVKRISGYRLHRIDADLKDYWSVKVSDNWRIIFRHEGGDAFDVHMIDYH